MNKKRMSQISGLGPNTLMHSTRSNLILSNITLFRLGAKGEKLLNFSFKTPFLSIG